MLCLITSLSIKHQLSLSVFFQPALNYKALRDPFVRNTFQREHKIQTETNPEAISSSCACRPHRSAACPHVKLIKRRRSGAESVMPEAQDSTQANADWSLDRNPDRDLVVFLVIPN